MLILHLMYEMIAQNIKKMQLQCTPDNLKCSGPENLVQIIRTLNYPKKIWYKIVKNIESGPRKHLRLYRNTNYP